MAWTKSNIIIEILYVIQNLITKMLPHVSEIKNGKMCGKKQNKMWLALSACY